MAVSPSQAAQMDGGAPDQGLAQGYEQLLALLDHDNLVAGRRLEALRQKLRRLFAWRGANDPEDLADETLDRVARQLARGVEIEAEDPYRYACGVAFRVFKESLRRRERWNRARGELESHPGAHAVVGPVAQSADDARLGCLEGCLDGLGGGKRELILDYYQGERSAKILARRELAEKLDIKPTTLRLRALRIREKLEVCVLHCLRGVA